MTINELSRAERLARATTGIVESLRAQGFPAEVSTDGTTITVGTPRGLLAVCLWMQVLGARPVHRLRCLDRLRPHRRTLERKRS
jgi:hypothetical protein